MIVLVDYASPSVFESSRDEALVGVAANARRPVRFHGWVKENGFILRVALRALGEAIWSNDSWVSQADLLDPVITVHPDRIVFEAFSQDQSSYVCLIVDPSVFDQTEELVTGTTNIDFTAWLWGALGEMRTSRRTKFRIGSEGMEVSTTTAGGRFERKVDLPDTWVRGFLQVQAAMAMPGTRLTVQPIDLLAALRYLRYTKARVSPRALRYEFEPGQDARLVLEPWEHVVALRDASHNYTERKVTRVWGRRRLKLIEGLLPFAESVDIYLKGRALPSFYAVKLPGMTFVLGMTGFSASGFTGTGGFDLLAAAAKSDDALLEPALEILRQQLDVSAADLAQRLNIDAGAATRLLVRICRRGQAMFDVESRTYRHRELFETPADEATYFPPDLRTEKATKFLEEGKVQVDACVVQETTKTRRLKTPDGSQSRQITYRDWRITGEVAGTQPVEIVVNNTGQIIFGRCTCRFFNDNLLNQGPCEHMLALFEVSSGQRVDEATSAPAPEATTATVKLAPSPFEVSQTAGGNGEAETGDEDDAN